LGFCEILVPMKGSSPHTVVVNTSAPQYSRSGNGGLMSKRYRPGKTFAYEPHRALSCAGTLAKA
jgi:hypothetical protein